jgi:hypothetical protein
MKDKNVHKKSRVEEWDEREKELKRKFQNAGAPMNDNQGHVVEPTARQEAKFNASQRFRMTLVSLGIFLVAILFLIWTVLDSSPLFLFWLAGITSAIISGAVFCNYAKYLAIWLFNSITQNSLN